MKRLYANLRSWNDFLNIVLIGIVLMIIKTSNGIQHLKMIFYKLCGIPCHMSKNHKFGDKICVIEKTNVKTMNKGTKL
jgi:hypothetical protein